MWTLGTRSLLPPLYSPHKRWRSGRKEGIPLFGKEGSGEILRRRLLSMNSLVTITPFLERIICTDPGWAGRRGWEEVNNRNHGSWG